MKKLFILPIVGMVLCLGACDRKEKETDIEPPANVIQEDYTLVEADYAEISNNSTNKKIAEQAGVGKDLDRVKTDLSLSGTIPGATYLPAYLAQKYSTADEGSSVKVTYNFKKDTSDLLSDYSSIKIYTPSNKMYADIYGNTEFAPYLNETTENKVTDLLKGYEDPKEGDVVFVDYRLSKGSVGTDLLSDPMLWQNFEGIATGKLTSLKDWYNGGDWFISSKGGADWKVASYDANQYVQFSANNTTGECDAWLVAPAVSIGPNDKLSFDVAVSDYNADCLSVLISTDFDGQNVDAAGWTDITSAFTIPRGPARGFGSLASAGEYFMGGYDGHNVRIAFKYAGDGVNEKTTAYQIDNVMIGSKIPAKGGCNSEPAYALKVYNEQGKWENQNKNVYVLAYKDYLEMGLSDLNFTSETPAVNYIPAYLAKQVGYPLEGDVRVVAYRYNNGEKVVINSDEYIYSAEAGRWAWNKIVVERTEQFVYKNTVWSLDPVQ